MLYFLGEIDPSPRSVSLLFNCDFWLTNPKTSLSHLNQNAPCSFWLVLIFDFLFSGEIDPSILSKCDLCFTDPCQNGASCRSLPNRDFECRSVETFYRLEPFYKRTYPAAPYPSCSCASGARRDSTGRRAQRWSTPATATRASTGPTAKCSRREDSCEWIPRPCHKVCQWEVLVGWCQVWAVSCPCQPSATSAASASLLKPSLSILTHFTLSLSLSLCYFQPSALLWHRYFLSLLSHFILSLCYCYVSQHFSPDTPNMCPSSLKLINSQLTTYAMAWRGAFQQWCVHVIFSLLELCLTLFSQSVSSTSFLLWSVLDPNDEKRTK